jgi:hypothetical protein
MYCSIIGVMPPAAAGIGVMPPAAAGIGVMPPAVAGVGVARPATSRGGVPAKAGLSMDVTSFKVKLLFGSMR